MEIEMHPVGKKKANGYGLDDFNVENFTTFISFGMSGLIVYLFSRIIKAFVHAGLLGVRLS